MTYRIARLVLVASPVLVLTGCAHYEPRPLTAPANLTAYEARRVDAPEVTRSLQDTGLVTAWPPPAWDLDALTLVAFHYHPDLEVARAQWSVARATIQRAGERPNPSVSGGPGFNSSSVAGLTPWMFLLNIDFGVETAGKRGIRVAQATAAADASRFTIASQAWRVRSRLRDSLLAVYTASELAALVGRQLDVQQQVVALLERQFGAGAISSFELTQARVAFDRIRLTLRDIERLQGEARVRLAGSVGMPQEALAPLTLSFDGFRGLPAVPDDVALRQQALVRRPDVLGALAAYDAAQAGLQLEIARQYPDVRLGPGYEMDQADHKWRLIGGGLLPIFTRNKGAIAEAEARRTAAAADFNAIQARALEQVDASLVRLRAALDKLATADQLLREQRTIEQTTETRLKAGEISRLDLATVQVQGVTLEQARFEAFVDAHGALGAVEEALQSPLDLARWLKEPR